jgi:catechol 2,3-dioxygenase-like lactoylglutathione lyase family enzyme
MEPPQTTRPARPRAQFDIHSSKTFDDASAPSEARASLPRLSHLSIGVADLGAAKSFYADVLGLAVYDLGNDAYVEWPGFLLVLDAAAPVAAEAFHFGFAVGSDAEVDTWAALLRERGATIVKGPISRPTLRSPTGRVVGVADPDGHLIEIYSGD